MTAVTFLVIGNALLAALLVYQWRTTVRVSRQLRKAEASLAELKEKWHESEVKSAEAVQKSQFEMERAAKLTEALGECQAKIESLLEQNSELKARLAEVTTAKATELKAAQEKIEMLSQAREELSAQFEKLANDILEKKTSIFDKRQHETLANVIRPLNEQIKEFKQRLEQVHSEDLQDRNMLRGELLQLKALNQQMSEEAERLVKALKGDKKAQGTWGEVVLARLLELSGLREGIEYSREKTLKGETAKRYRPDVIVHLPDNKDIVVDAKVSLSAYEQYVAASDDEKVAKKWLDEHVAAIRNHIKRLAEKRYEMLESIATLDFVFIFVPIEPAYLLAVQHDPNLFSFAFEKKIILVSPTTLLSTLRIVENVWRFERQNKNAEEIAKQAGALLDKLAGFVEDLENVGNKLDAARKHWQEAMYKLKDGKSGTVFRRAQKIMELGARSKKSQAFTALPEAGQQDVE